MLSYSSLLGTQMVAAKAAPGPGLRVKTGLTVGPCRPPSAGQASTRAPTSSALAPRMLATTL